jgi:hypothetical protein
MKFEELVAVVGEERYRAACRWAWRTAAGTGERSEPQSGASALDEVPHELADVWHDGKTSLPDRVDLALRIYQEMPCYANTMELKSFYGKFGTAEKRRFWDMYRAALDSDDDRLAEPVAYSLWVDFYEDQETVHEAWQETSRCDETASRRRLQRVLEIAGPVPWHLKEPVFEQLIGDAAWHPFIFRALVGSAFDAYGALDPRAAKTWLDRLHLSEATTDLPALRNRLSGS